MGYAPVALFVYNRLGHTKKTINFLKKNFLAGQTKIYIFSDAPKNKESEEKVFAVRGYINSITGFKSVEIIERKKNLGLANSIIDGVTKVINKHKKIIVLEDDLVTSKHFLEYMNNALNLYNNNEKVASISGYVYPIKDLPETFFLRGADCWGWATWKRAWDLFEKDGAKLLHNLEKKDLINEFDFNNSYRFSDMLKNQIVGKNDSWAIRWYASTFLYKKLTLYPGRSFVYNSGIEGSGSNGGCTKVFDTKPTANKLLVEDILIKESKEARKKFELFFKNQSGTIARIKRRLMFFK